jgi:hypothetical protein
MYRMMMAEMKPTPKPEIRRPETMRPRPVYDAVWRMQPTIKTMQPEMIVTRRPK